MKAVRILFLFFIIHIVISLYHYFHSRGVWDYYLKVMDVRRAWWSERASFGFNTLFIQKIWVSMDATDL